MPTFSQFQRERDFKLIAGSETGEIGGKYEEKKIGKQVNQKKEDRERENGKEGKEEKK